MLALGELKYTPNPFVRDTRKTYTKKDKKLVHMMDRPTYPKMQRSQTKKENSYTFSVQPHIILMDLMKRGILHPLECSSQDDNNLMGCFDAYCTYHQWKGHATNFCKTLEVAILELVEKGRYIVNEILTTQGPIINIISMEKEVCANLRRGCPCNAPNLIIIEQVSLMIINFIVWLINWKIHLLKLVYMIFYTSQVHMDILYVFFKNETIATNILVAMFSKKIRTIKECDAIYFYKYENLNQ